MVQVEAPYAAIGYEFSDQISVVHISDTSQPIRVFEVQGVLIKFVELKQYSVRTKIGYFAIHAGELEYVQLTDEMPYRKKNPLKVRFKTSICQINENDWGQEFREKVLSYSEIYQHG